MSSERLQIPVVASDSDREHDPDGEVWVGVRTPGTELPARATAIRDALLAGGAKLVAAEAHDDNLILRVHSAEYLEWLSGAWQEWQGSGLTEVPGQDRVVPYLFPHPAFTDGMQVNVPVSAAARAGRFAYDTMTLIGPGTWQGARGAADAALTAADLVLDGARFAYALCRPPGHHATRSALGGSCYLNNAAIAAAQLADSTGGKVAIIDIDAHHGNGTQAIFYEDPEVLTGSVHVDPGAGWFPHFLGFAGETGTGQGAGANLNFPLAPGSGDDAWLERVTRLADWTMKGQASALVVCLGVDAAAGDPESPLAVSEDGYRMAGEVIASTGLPTVIVQEGGYDLTRIGPLVLASLLGFQRGAA